MRQPINKQDLVFDENGSHVKYAVDGIEKCLIRFALEFARHNLREFIAAYSEETNLGDASTTRNELEELSQMIRDVNYFLLLPSPAECAVRDIEKARTAVEELKKDLNAQ
jgi:hypothetical protein